MADVLNVKLGVCKVIVGGVDLGHTIGGAELVYTPEYHTTKVDRYTGVAERFLISENMAVRVPLAESTLAVIRKAIPFASQSGGKATIGSYAGKRLSEKAVPVVLHPVENDDNDRSDDVVLYKGASTGEITLGYKNDGERIVETMFEAFVDESKADGNLLGLIGDSAA